MAPGSPLLFPPSPTKKSSQELPYFPLVSRRSDPLPTNGTNGVNGAHALTVPEPDTTAGLTASVIADEMDVDSGTATQAPHAPQAPAPRAARDVRSPVRTPELQTMQPHSQGHNNNNNNNTTNNNENTDNNGKHAYRNHNHTNGHHRGVSQAREPSPETPGHIPSFDWDEFEARYEQALNEMNGQEKELLEEFDRLVQYFNVWASAAAAHDDERAVKR
ncbi:hypothetical protein SPI_00375 [Niveomyces insectorum RCEF 264]|uniref:Uncharacterized protein n=1 Tax=Niveomyces insectorum RCEF 264 TaxID=1081102 RepID=A0A168A309_9HYPO|nr:hypothetical protein SPI_00375 [Niveomyces insectorum RCEF 264]